jgi:hypothetical protein
MDLAPWRRTRNRRRWFRCLFFRPGVETLEERELPSATPLADSFRVTGDFNGDGRTDIALVGQNWNPALPGLSVRELLAIGTGNYMVRSQDFGAVPGAFAALPLVADLNGDGRSDLISCYYDATRGQVIACTLVAQADGTFATRPIVSVLGTDPALLQQPVLAADVTGTGRADLIFSYYDSVRGLIVETALSEGNGTFATPVISVLGNNSALFQRPTLAADVTGSGRADLVFLHYDFVRGVVADTALGQKDGTFAAPVASLLGKNPALLTKPTLVGDVLGNHRSDLIFPYLDGTSGVVVATALAQPDGTFATPVLSVVSSASALLSTPVLAGPVDSNGPFDLVFRYFDTARGLIVATAAAQPDGSFAPVAEQQVDGGADLLDVPTLIGAFTDPGRDDLVFLGTGYDTPGLSVRTYSSSSDGSWKLVRQLSDWFSPAPIGDLPTRSWSLYETQPVYAPLAPPTAPLLDRDPLEGYASSLSVSPGQVLNFYVSTTGSSLTVTYVQLHYNLQQLLDGQYGTPVTAPAVYAGQQRRLPLTPYWQGPGWENGPADFSVAIPATWASGLYAAEITSNNGYQTYITFIVNPPPTQHNRLALIVSTNTWNAYNNWGGESQYSYPGAPGPYPNPPLDLSFLRPNPRATPVLYDDPHGPYADGHLVPGDVLLLTWLRSAGYNVDVYSDADFARGIPGLNQYGALLIDSHPEYWSVGEYQNLQAYEKAGGNVLSLGGNAIYEEVQYSPDYTTLIFRTQGPTRADNSFAANGLPEINLLGVASWGANGDGSFAAPYAVTAAGAASFLLQGTNLAQGSLIGQAGVFGAASGWETEEVNKGFPSPPGTIVLAHGTNAQGPADMVYELTPAGGFVFAVGSVSFVGSLVVDPTLQRIIRNGLNAALKPGASTVAFTGIGSPTITYGTATTTVSGLLQGPSGKPPVPAGEMILLHFNGVTVSAYLDPRAAFSFTLDTSSLGAGPVPLTLSYAGDHSFAPASVALWLVVTPAPLTIRAEDETVVYGSALPAGSVQYTGFVKNDGPASLTSAPTVSAAAGASSVGTYVLSAGGAVDPNYTIHYVPGTLTIVPAPLTVVTTAPAPPPVDKPPTTTSVVPPPVAVVHTVSITTNVSLQSPRLLAPHQLRSHAGIVSFRGVTVAGPGHGALFHLQVHTSAGRLRFLGAGVQVTGNNSATITLTGTASALTRALDSLALHLLHPHSKARVSLLVRYNHFAMRASIDIV